MKERKEERRKERKKERVSFGKTEGNTVQKT